MFVHVIYFLSNPFLIDTSWQLFCIPLSLVSDHHVKDINTRNIVLVASFFSRIVSFEGHSAVTKSDLIQRFGGFSFCLSLPKWLPGFEVEEECVQDIRGEGDSIDGVEQVDLLHNSHVGETVLLLRKT